MGLETVHGSLQRFVLQCVRCHLVRAQRFFIAMCASSFSKCAAFLYFCISSGSG